MLAPIITKDMKLFPTRPLPPGIKNVRSRAQSLDQFSAPVNPRAKTASKPRVSQSTGNLPVAAARSPPKASTTRKSTLSAIQEGVELKTHKEKEMIRHEEVADLRGGGETKRKGPLRWLQSAFRTHKKDDLAEEDAVSTRSS